MSLEVRGSTSVSLRSCMVRLLGVGRGRGPRLSVSWVGLMMKLRLMLRYLLSKLQEMSSEVRSPRLLNMEVVAGGLPDDCLSPSIKSWLQVCRLWDSLQGGDSGGGCRCLDSSASWGVALCGMLGLDLLFVTCAELQDTRGAWEQPGQEGVCRAKFGRDRSITVSLEEMLEDEDMLSRWLGGSSLLHSRSLRVASVQIWGTTDGAAPPAAPATRTWPSLSIFLTGVLGGPWLNSALWGWTGWSVGWTGVLLDSRSLALWYHFCAVGVFS